MSRHIWRATILALLVVAAPLLVGACATSSTSRTLPTCASVLPGATAINLQSQGFIYPIAFPQGSVGTTPQQTASGPGLFTVYAFSVCTPNTTSGGVTSYFSTQLPSLPHGWMGAQTFPEDGGLMAGCGESSCWFDPKGGPIYYLVFDQLADHGNGIITYRARWAVSPDFPTCGANYTSQTAVHDVYFLPGYTPQVPLPPISSTVQDNAPGGVRGFDVCSPGTVQSVSAFMMKELPATGWTKVAAAPACVYAAECWKNGSAVISWDAGSDPLNWHIAWRAALT